MRHVVLVGPMGSGKTTLGMRLAAELGRPFIDSDDLLLEATGRTGRELAATAGVSELHRLERQVFLEAISGPEPSVVAAAASVVDDEAVRQALTETVCVFLTAGPEVLAGRTPPNGHRREVGRGERLERRDPIFEKASDLTIDTGQVSESEAVSLILAVMSDPLE